MSGVIPVDQIPILDLTQAPADLVRAEGIGRIDGWCPWTADVIYVRAGLTATRRAFVIEHERQHIRQARRYASPGAWKAAYEAANVRGYAHNVFEHAANLAAFAAGHKPR